MPYPYGIKPGQRWVAADGGGYGYLIVRHLPNEEVEVEPTYGGRLSGAPTRTIDAFKLTYRYKRED